MGSMKKTILTGAAVVASALPASARDHELNVGGESVTFDCAPVESTPDVIGRVDQNAQETDGLGVVNVRDNSGGEVRDTVGHLVLREDPSNEDNMVPVVLAGTDIVIADMPIGRDFVSDSVGIGTADNNHVVIDANNGQFVIGGFAIDENGQPSYDRSRRPMPAESGPLRSYGAGKVARLSRDGELITFTPDLVDSARGLAGERSGLTRHQLDLALAGDDLTRWGDNVAVWGQDAALRVADFENFDNALAATPSRGVVFGNADDWLVVNGLPNANGVILNPDGSFYLLGDSPEHCVAVDGPGPQPEPEPMPEPEPEGEPEPQPEPMPEPQPEGEPEAPEPEPMPEPQPEGEPEAPEPEANPEPEAPQPEPEPEEEPEPEAPMLIVPPNPAEAVQVGMGMEVEGPRMKVPAGLVRNPNQPRPERPAFVPPVMTPEEAEELVQCEVVAALGSGNNVIVNETPDECTMTVCPDNNGDGTVEIDLEARSDLGVCIAAGKKAGRPFEYTGDAGPLNRGERVKIAADANVAGGVASLVNAGPGNDGTAVAFDKDHADVGLDLREGFVLGIRGSAGDVEIRENQALGRHKVVNILEGNGAIVDKNKGGEKIKMVNEGDVAVVRWGHVSVGKTEEEALKRAVNYKESQEAGDGCNQTPGSVVNDVRGLLAFAPLGLLALRRRREDEPTTKN
jgi:hypothetical protein